MAKKFYLKSAIINCLRLLSFQYPPRAETLRDSRVSRGLYKCSSCGEIKKKKLMHIDHIHPVIDPIVGFVDWNTYISRLFCPKEGWQVICIQCHNIKTTLEDSMRVKK